MTAQEASEQAVAPTGDVPTSTQDGQPSTGVIAVGSVSKPGQAETQESKQVEATEAAAPKQEAAVPETLTPKNQRKSDKEWQQTQEKASEAETLQDQLKKTQDLAERLRFERDNPIVLSPEFKEQWESMESDARWANFSREERVKYLVKPDYTSVRQDMLNQAAKQQGSVSTSARTTQTEELSPSLVRTGAAWFGSEEEARKLYKKYGIKG